MSWKSVLPHFYPPSWQGTQKLVVSSGGALYQPVTMVTSQGQVVTQAIPQGAIQIQNTQVSVRAQVCAHVHWLWGEGNNHNCLLPARPFIQGTYVITLFL